MTTPQPTSAVGPRIKMLRAERRLTLADVANASDLTRSFLSKLERNQTAVSVASLLKIAAALEVPLSTLFEPADGVTTVRAEEGETFGADDAIARVLTPTAERRLLATRTDLQAGTVEPLEDTRQGEVEFLFIISGTLEIDTSAGSVTLHQGDAATITSSPARTIRSPERGIGTSFLRVVSSPENMQN